MNPGQKIKIYWHDAVIYSHGDIPTDLPLKITCGNLVKESKEFIIVENPDTKIINAKQILSKKVIRMFIAKNKKQTFFFIPRGMIQKIERV